MVVPAELMTTCLGGRASQTCMHDRRSRFHGFHAITSEALIKCPWTICPTSLPSSRARNLWVAGQTPSPAHHRPHQYRDDMRGPLIGAGDCWQFQSSPSECRHTTNVAQCEPVINRRHGRCASWVGQVGGLQLMTEVIQGRN